MHDHAPEPTVSPRTSVLTCLALLALTALTIALASVNLGGFNTPVALGIALVKATLVGALFMNLRGSSPLHRMALIAAVLWLGILMMGTMDDLLTRGLLTIPGK